MTQAGVWAQRRHAIIPTEHNQRDVTSTDDKDVGVMIVTSFV